MGVYDTPSWNGRHFGGVKWRRGQWFCTFGFEKTEETGCCRYGFCPRDVLRLEKFGSACAIYIDHNITKDIDRRVYRAKVPRIIDRQSMSCRVSKWRGAQDAKVFGFLRILEDCTIFDIERLRKGFVPQMETVRFNNAYSKSQCVANRF